MPLTSGIVAPSTFRIPEESQFLKELRKEVLRKRKQKEKSMITWIKNRVKEISTWSGVSLIAVGLLWIFAGSLFTWVAYLAVAWGIFSIVKKQG